MTMYNFFGNIDREDIQRMVDWIGVQLTVTNVPLEGIKLDKDLVFQIREVINDISIDKVNPILILPIHPTIGAVILTEFAGRIGKLPRVAHLVKGQNNSVRLDRLIDLEDVREVSSQF